METNSKSHCSIFNFIEPAEYLNHVYREKKKKNPEFSLRAWSRKLGFSTPSLLSDVLQKKRKLGPRIVARLVEGLKLTLEEEKYFNLLIHLSSAKTSQEQKVYQELLRSVKGAGPHTDLAIEKFRFICDWHHLALLEMMDLKDFKIDPIHLSRRLNNEVSPFLVEIALKRLEKLGLVKKLSKTCLTKTTQVLKIGDEVPNEAMRHFHHQVMGRAKEAFNHEPIDNRDYRSTTLALRKSDLSRAKSIIKRCHAEIQELAALNGSGDEVYILHTQFFQLTKEQES